MAFLCRMAHGFVANGTAVVAKLGCGIAGYANAKLIYFRTFADVPV